MNREQEWITREFYTKVLSDDSLFTGDAGSNRGSSLACVRDLLGYTIYAGQHVHKDEVKTVPYGHTVKVTDRWAEDTEACRRALTKESTSEATEDRAKAEASRSKPSAYTKIRKALFPKDV